MSKSEVKLEGPINNALDDDQASPQRYARKITAFAISNFGTGQHPAPEADGPSLRYFMKQYAAECLSKVVASKDVTPEAVREARAAIRFLGAETCINCGALIKPEFDACEACV